MTGFELVPASAAGQTQMLCPGTNCLELTESGGLCGACWGFRRVLHQRITGSWHVAHGLLEPSRVHGDQVSGGAGPGSRPPLDSTVFAVIESTLIVVVGWASRIRERLDRAALPGLSTARTGWLFDHAMPDLSQHDETLNSIEKIEYYADLYRCYASLRLVGHEAVRESEHLFIACPSCDRMTIIIRRYGDAVACLTCGRQWGQAAWYAQLNAIRVV